MATPSSFGHGETHLKKIGGCNDMLDDRYGLIVNCLIVIALMMGTEMVPQTSVILTI
jgi:hypothetical protein